MSDRLTADVNQPRQEAYANDLPVDYNFARNMNAFTGEYYEPDPFSFIALEQASAADFGNPLMLLSLEASGSVSEITENWGSAEEFLRIAGGIG